MLKKKKQCRAAIDVGQLLIRCCFQLCSNSLREVDLGSYTQRLKGMMTTGEVTLKLLCKPKNPPLLIQTKSKGRGTSLHLQFYLVWIQENCNFWCSLKRKRYVSLPTKYKMMYWPFVNIRRYSQKSWEVVLTFFIFDHREDKYFACGYSARMWWHRKMGHWLLFLCPEDIKPQCHWIL